MAGPDDGRGKFRMWPIKVTAVDEAIIFLQYLCDTRAIDDSSRSKALRLIDKLKESKR